ncbi:MULTISPECIES: serpin family protein [unclassified Paenibacillus]|uniref:serpin family protein n=1 Tax=unclassified Paenibacillus TaxID=185978 RepID=UPI0024060C7C|nr:MULTISPECIES: serpin family protein [unclassified Paenibacillus]MDF9844577.1 serine protease inhibitor [Paenibacillus sp. PastF-2]MDF9851138.1 serine protease inhibitor [Paenibacillus sp. PastM-2]MDF9856227.1 serine protease inhibitor [Paenibacillus sp. PastF-1]MDH6481544.1 serine protease inhibitor [Paenibacillus sp. PastH-2]MDH6510442.1 serine protease inhibitor [Paenibacillus sp. PastM-3]
MKKRPALPLSVLLLPCILLSGCGSGGSGDFAGGPAADSAMNFSERAESAAKLDARLARQSNELGLRLFSKLRELGDEAGNLTISPYSISAALALAYNGSGGETAEELGQLLGYAPGELEQLNAGSKALLPLLNDAGPGIQLELANSVWADQGIRLRKEYLKAVKTSYGAEVRTTNLSAEKSVTVTEVNRWVEDQTAGKIDRMLEQPPGGNTVALLVNALYFKGAWQEKFPVERSEPAQFHTGNNTPAEVMMMKQTGNFAYAETEDWQAVRLPYGEGQMEMLVILPSEGSSADEVLQGGLPAGEQFAERFGTVGLPRFTAEYGVDLKEAVQALGMKTPFDPATADFPALTDVDTPIFIGSIIHKTFIEVNEAGTEAAASTLAAMDGGAAPTADLPFELTADRPFIFIIEDTQTGLWLFLGSIGKPLQAE